MTSPVYIHSALRTPIGCFNGVLKGFTAVELGKTVVKALVQDKTGDVEQVVMGNVLSAGTGQAPARQVALGAGLKPSTVCTTVNKVCSSGLKAVIMGAQSIMLGDARTVVAGGMESMSNAPLYLSPQMRRGVYGASEVQDAILRDGLIDPYQHVHMGVCAEETAAEYKVSREEQDEYAVMSYSRAARAWTQGLFSHEVVNMDSKGVQALVEDEEYKKIDYERLPQLRPAFIDLGTVTAGNASKISDGASAVLLSSSKRGAVARIVAYGEAECLPQRFTIAPSLAVPLALERAFPGKSWKQTIGRIDLFEVNEAFAVVAIVNRRLLNGIPVERYNVRGGGVSLGHPVGSSGCRILVTLIHALQPGQTGLVAVCNGGGGASAMVVERL